MEHITLVENAIHRPDEPRHFMEITHPATRYRAFANGQLLAATDHPLKLSEVANHVLDPVIYFPIADVNTALLRQTAKTTHCPLKGDTAYFDYVNGETLVTDAGWRYVKTFEFARALAQHIAFDPGRIVVERG